MSKHTNNARKESNMKGSSIKSVYGDRITQGIASLKGNTVQEETGITFLEE